MERRCEHVNTFHHNGSGLRGVWKDFDAHEFRTYSISILYWVPMGNTLSRMARQRELVCAAVGDLVKNPASLLRSGVKRGVVPWRSSLANYALWRKGVIMSTPLFTTVVVSVGCGRISVLTNFGLIVFLYNIG